MAWARMPRASCRWASEASTSSSGCGGGSRKNRSRRAVSLRTAVSAYVCAKALAACALPSHEGVLKITAFPGGRPVGTVNFLQSEEMIELEGCEVEDKKMLTDKMTMLFVGREAERRVDEDRAVGVHRVGLRTRQQQMAGLVLPLAKK